MGVGALSLAADGVLRLIGLAKVISTAVQSVMALFLVFCLIDDSEHAVY